MAIMIWSIVAYCSDAGEAMVVYQKAVQPTYQYFDANRAKKGIVKIDMIKSTGTETCPGGTVPLNLYTWPGTVAGYKNGATWGTGTGPAGSSTVAKLPAFTVNRWRSSMRLCATRYASTYFYRANKDIACPAKHFQCSECECAKPTTNAAGTLVAADKKKCPLNAWKLATGYTPVAGSGEEACHLGASNSYTDTTDGNKVYKAYCRWG